MTDEQVGKYIRLLCLQHQTGRLSEKHMLSICKAYDEDVFDKFKKDSKGLYYNNRLEEEINKRSKFAESRRNNAKGKRKITESTSKAYAKHMENENENENEDIIINKIEKNKIGVDVILDLYPVVQDVNTVNIEWDFLNDATRQKVIDHAKMFIQHLKDTKQTEYTPFLENYLTKKMYLAPKMPYEHKIETKSDYDLIRERINNEN